MADYLASRKELTVGGIEYEYNNGIVSGNVVGGNSGSSAEFGDGSNNNSNSNSNSKKGNKAREATEEDITTYVLTFGKHSGEKLIDVWRRDKSYCKWMIENITREPVKTFLKQLSEGKSK